MTDVTVRTGRAGELVAVMRVLDAGLLDADAGAVRSRLEDGDCLVAEASGRVVGVAVLAGDVDDAIDGVADDGDDAIDGVAAAGDDATNGTYLDSIAVSPSRRGRGVGTRLVEAASARRGRLVADFDERVRPFYESLGFRVEPRDDRFRGVLDAGDAD